MYTSIHMMEQNTAILMTALRQNMCTAMHMEQGTTMSTVRLKKRL